MKLETIEKAILVWGPISDEGIVIIKQSGWLVVVPENRPHMTGLKYNILKLKKASINYVYCNDNSIGLLFNKAKIFKTFIFCKSREEKSVTGFCGTLYAVLLSRLHKVPVEFLLANLQAQPDTGDCAILGGKKFILDENTKDFTVPANDETIEGELLL